MNTLQVELPPSLLSDQPGTWAYDTMSRRIILEIYPRIISENQEWIQDHPEVMNKLQALIDSVSRGVEGYLDDISDAHNDNETWKCILATIPDSSRNWLQAPWLISEYYFYRRVICAFDYFHTNCDMFARQKHYGLVTSIPAIESTLQSYCELQRIDADDIHDLLKMGIYSSLWGNKIDLSLWPARHKSQSQTLQDKTEHMAGTAASCSEFDLLQSFILQDDTIEVVQMLSSIQLQVTERSVGIIVDNAGYELFSDLLLAHILLTTKTVTHITLYCKGHPTFVSDVTRRDVFETITNLKKLLNDEHLQIIKDWESWLSQGVISIDDSLFWCQPIAFWDTPSEIVEKLKKESMVFVKGDANYRRLLGDRSWNFDFDHKKLLVYWPVPVCALRTLKAEIACGINEESQRRAASKDPKWLVSGRWGVVHLGGHTSSS